MTKAWRLIGVAAKTCFELGLHLAPVEVPPPEKHATGSFTQRLFCCVYVWDHRCAFITGLPFTMQVADIHEKRLEVVSVQKHIWEAHDANHTRIGSLRSISFSHDRL
jgi:hypothetical protein